MREPYSTFFSECVTWIIVTPSSSFIFLNNSIISSPCFEFKLPVGSSAKINFGFATKARAIPTSCCWPPPGIMDDLETGISTIKKRSEGLLKFAEKYRSLNKITTLNLKETYVRDLFESLHHLMQPTLEQKNIALEIVLKAHELKIEVDPDLIEQVLINLLVNAIEAVKDCATPKIILSAQLLPTNKVAVKITDNGTGIEPELLDKIFIPFFSTKKSGSGSGLSLCKQIMMLHKGNIQAYSIKNEGSVFTLVFI